MIILFISLCEGDISNPQFPSISSDLGFNNTSPSKFILNKIRLVNNFIHSLPLY